MRLFIRKVPLARNYFVTVLCVFLLSISPDLIWALCVKGYPLWFGHKAVIYLAALALILPLIRGTAFQAAFCIFLGVIGCIQWGHIAYYGTPIAPYTIRLMFIEHEEVVLEGMAVAKRLFYVPLLGLLPWLGVFFLLSRTRDTRFTHRIGWVLLPVLLAYFPYRVTYRQEPVVNFMPRDGQLSVYNSARAFSAYFFGVVPRSPSKAEIFKPYKITRTEVTTPRNVILILGEGVSVSHNSLFGYERETSPLLKRLARQDPNFVVNRGLSSSTTTLNSVTMLLNLQREPKNFLLNTQRPHHLFKLARQSGFKTFYLSAQMESLLTTLPLSEIDVKASLPREYPAEFKAKREMAFIDLLKNLDMGEKNFIIIHQRNLHAPYSENYLPHAPRFDKFKGSADERVDTYDNAMLYNDFLLFSFLEYFKGAYKSETYVYFIPDHGEAINEDGVWSHITLKPIVAQIPFFFHAMNEGDAPYVKRIKEAYLPSHYEMGVWIAEKLGYTVDNPNITDKNIAYINGTDPAGGSGHIVVTRDPLKKAVSYSEVFE